MHERFQHALEVYQELAKHKAEHQAGSSKESTHDESLKDIEAAIRYHEQSLAKRRGQQVKIQRRIFALQEEKAGVMARLKDRLATLDDPNRSIEREQGEYDVFCMADGRLATKQGVVTEGMLYTDGEWGLRYHPDKSVPRRIRKRYCIETAKRELRALLDRQIIEDKIGSDRTEDGIRNAYGAFKKMRGHEEDVGGWVAERLIKTYFKRLSVDFDFDLDVIETDVYEDVEHKIDFVIRRRSRARGVEIDAREDRRDMGIQFTMRNDVETLEHKKRQIRRVKHEEGVECLRVEDIVVISMPLMDVKGLYRKWKTTSASGGPAELWSIDQKEAVFRRVLSGIIPDAEIEAQWRIVSGEDRLRIAQKRTP